MFRLSEENMVGRSLRKREYTRYNHYLVQIDQLNIFILIHQEKIQ